MKLVTKPLCLCAALAAASLALARQADTAQTTSRVQMRSAIVCGPNAGGAKAAGPGTPYCFGVNCPCGNDDPDAGCVNSTGAGALLDGFGTSSVAAADLGLDITGLPPSSVTLILLSSQTAELPFKDGKLCLGGTVWRLWKHFNSGQTGSLQIPNIANLFAIGGPFIVFAPGQIWHFQSWYRDPPATGTSCGLKSNLTNGYTVAFLP